MVTLLAGVDVQETLETRQKDKIETRRTQAEGNVFAPACSHTSDFDRKQQHQLLYTKSLVQ